jgi:hypothetical protein
MADNLQDRGPRDRQRIDIHEDWELRYWTEALGATKEELAGAVAAVGVQVDDVKRYLAGRGKSARKASG